MNEKLRKLLQEPDVRKDEALNHQNPSIHGYERYIVELTNSQKNSAIHPSNHRLCMFTLPKHTLVISKVNLNSIRGNFNNIS